MELLTSCSGRTISNQRRCLTLPCRTYSPITKSRGRHRSSPPSNTRLQRTDSRRTSAYGHVQRDQTAPCRREMPRSCGVGCDPCGREVFRTPIVLVLRLAPSDATFIHGMISVRISREINVLIHAIPGRINLQSSPCPSRIPAAGWTGFRGAQAKALAELTHSLFAIGGRVLTQVRSAQQSWIVSTSEAFRPTSFPCTVV